MRLRRSPYLTLVLSLFLSGLTALPSDGAEPTIQGVTPFTSYIQGVGNVWTGKIPTKVAFASNDFCEDLDFSIQGLLPIGVLSDRALGVKVEFEIWSDQGEKVAYDTVFSSSWNPAGPDTAVSISMPSNCAGKFTMLIRTIYETRTNGLLSSYLSDEKKLGVEFSGGRSLSNNVATVQTTKPYVAIINGVGEVWSANIPTAITLIDGSFSSRIQFQIDAILPYKILADRASGTSIEFEIWESTGKKIADDYFSSYNWSPITKNSLVDIYLGSEVGPGTYNLLVRTIYKTNTDGLLSSYLKTEFSQGITISGTARQKSTQPKILASSTYISNIAGVGAIWTGSLPKQVQLPDSSSSKLEFTIKGLLPIKELTDRALGVEVEFEIWSEKGWKVANKTIFSSDWNTRAPDTTVSMYMYSDRFNDPTTLRVITTYSTKTNGLLTSYLEDIANFPITVLGKSTTTSERGRTDKDYLYFGNVKQVGDIWKGAIPTEVTLPTSGYSKEIQFQIEGLIAYKTLASKSLGVQVEFEIWSDDGEKIGYETIYPSDWNPVGPKTLVRISLPSQNVSGVHTLLIRTIYETNTNGLQTSYWEGKTSQKLKVNGGNPTAYEEHRVLETVPMTASITGVGSIWSGSVPSKIALSSSTYASKINWQLQAILPYSVLADRSTGTEVEFEVWSKAGEKVMTEDISPYDWSPVGNKTLAKMNIWSTVVAGTYTMIVRTIYKTNSNGLLSQYLKDEKTFSFVVVESGKIGEAAYFGDMRLSQKSIPGIAARFSSNNKTSPILVTSKTPLTCDITNGDLLLLRKGNCVLVANQKGAGALYDSTPFEVEFEILSSPPSKILSISTQDSSEGIKATWSAPLSDEKITKYEIGFSASTAPDLQPATSSSYSEFVVKESTSETRFTISPERIYAFLRSNTQSANLRGFHFRISVRAVSDSGTAEFWAWNYITASNLNSLLWSKYPPYADLKVKEVEGKSYFSAIENPASSLRMTGRADNYSWRVAYAPAGSNFLQFAYDPKGKEFQNSKLSQIEISEALISLDKIKSEFPSGGGVLLTVIPRIGQQESLDSRGSGQSFSAEELLKLIDQAKAEAEAKAKAEAEAKAKAEAEAKAKAEAEAKAKAENSLKKVTITCIKGKILKKVTGINPKCPSGYKRKA